MSKLSLIIITQNEAENLPRCIESVTFADEIVVVDSDSSDGTPEIARRYTDKVYNIVWQGFGKAKQTALRYATGEWVFSIDADEVVSEELAAEIKQVVANPPADVIGFRVNRLSNFLGRWIRHSGWYPDRILRLARRKQARFTDDEVHERMEADGTIRDLQGHLLHFTDPDWNHYLNKLVRYADVSAHMLYEQGRRASLLDMTVRPAYQFCKNYILHAGFLDGIPGFLLASGSAFHVFSKYANLWRLQRLEK